MSISSIFLRTNNLTQLLSALLKFLNWRLLQSFNISEKSIGSELRVPIYTIQRLQQNINLYPKEDVLNQKIHIQMMHALIHKIDKSGSIPATFTANELPQLTVLQSNSCQIRQQNHWLGSEFDWGREKKNVNSTCDWWGRMLRSTLGLSAHDFCSH